MLQNQSQAACWGLTRLLAAGGSHASEAQAEQEQRACLGNGVRFYLHLISLALSQPLPGELKLLSEASVPPLSKKALKRSSALSAGEPPSAALDALVNHGQNVPSAALSTPATEKFCLTLQSTMQIN